MADARTTLCDRVLEDLALLVDDQLDPALRDHVVDCDHCRDLRHEARMTAQKLPRAGGDYAHPDDFEARMLAALDARPPRARTTTPTLGTPVKTPESGPPVLAAVKTTPAPSVSTEAPALVPSRSNEVAVKSHEPAKLSASSARSRWTTAAVGTALFAAAALPIGLSMRGRTRPATTGTDTVASAAPSATANPEEARNPWHGVVAEVSRAAADRTGGLDVRLPGANDFTPLANGAAVPTGSEVRTDGRTRARIELADGTRLVLDRGTHLRLDPRTPRTAELRTGSLVADVAHIDTAPTARLATPGGSVTVLGTKFALTAADTHQSTVRVTRGTVRLADSSGREAEVKTGFEGTVAEGRAPSVAPAVGLARAVSWSEFGTQTRVEPDAPVLGLGELRARRPGQTDERDHAVRLAAHSVRVRIAGNQARTEIDETFSNETDHALEGIYRFPLPPQAQVERLALDVNGQMEDGAFVDRTRAAAIWRGVLRNAVRPMTQQVQTEEMVWVPGPWRDPALLEWQRGGRFELKIFPIPAHGSRRVSVAYTQTLEPSNGVRRYVYPLAHDANGSTRVEQFDVDVQVLGHDRGQGVRARGYALAEDATLTAGSPAGATRMAFSQSAFVPAGDMVVEYSLPDEGPGVTAWAFQPVGATAAPSVAAGGGVPVAVAGRIGVGVANAAQPTTATPPTTVPAVGTMEPAFVALTVRPQLPRWTDARPRDYALVLDASRSMVGERFARAKRLALAMISEMDPRDRVAVLTCDTGCRTSPGGLRFAGAETLRSIESFLATEEAHGASDLVAQVREAASVVAGARDRDARVVYLGDGAATAGWRAPDAIETEVSDAVGATSNGSSGRTTVTAVALGSDADTHVLQAMARAGGGAVVPFAPGEAVSASALAVLEATYGVTLRNPQLELPAGLTAAAPSRIGTVRAGGEFVVVARMSSAEVRGEAVLRGTVAGEPFEARYPLTVQASTTPGNAFVTRLYAATKIAELEQDGGPAARAEAVALSQRFHVASKYTSLLVLESDAMYRAFGVERNRDTSVAWTGDEGSVSTRAFDRTAIMASSAPADPRLAAREHQAEPPPVVAGQPAVTATPAPAPPVAEAAAHAALVANLNRNAGPAQVQREGVPSEVAIPTSASEEAERSSADQPALGNVGLLGTLGHGQGMGGLAGAGDLSGAAGFGSGSGRGSRAGVAGGERRVSAGASAGDDDDVGTVETNASAEAAQAPFARAAAPAPTTPMRGRSADALDSSDDTIAPARTVANSGGGFAAGARPAAGPMADPGLRGRAELTTRRRAPARPAPLPPAPPPRMDGEFTGNGQWMRRVWVRRATVNPDRGGSDAARSRVSTARAALLAMPDSRTRHQELYRWLAVSGDTDEAGDVATRWTARDALDPDALVRLSDVAARRGERDKAVRILGGTVDVRPGEPERVERMVQLFDRAGDATHACSFRVSLAELSPTDLERVSSAVRCERALGHTSAANRLLTRVTDEALRRRIEDRSNAPAGPTAAEEAPRGDLVLRATWDAPTDLDLAVVDGRGTRVSWLGGRARGVGTRDSHSLSAEALGLSRTGSGDYFIEIARSSNDGRPVRGTIEVTALGDQRRTFSFVLQANESTARVGRVTLTRESQLVPM